MSCFEFLEKRLLILSGKGGVGKSVLAATLAWTAAQKGKNTLLVELDTLETLPGIFGKTSGDTYQERTLAPDISCLHIDGKSGLEEYLQMVVKSKRLLQRVFKSPIYQYFVNIAPGLKELMAVGKLWDLEKKTFPGTHRPQYDLIIVDTPATGHTVSYLQMPMTASGTVKRGFVKKEAQKVVDLLQDPARTSFNIVTTLAEMPVNEAVELHRTVSTKLSIPIGCIFVNQVFPPFFTGSDYESFLKWKTILSKAPQAPSDKNAPSVLEEQRILACAESWEKRKEAQDYQRDRLLTEIRDPIIMLPFVYESENNLEMIQRLSRTLETGGKTLSTERNKAGGGPCDRS